MADCIELGKCAKENGADGIVCVATFVCYKVEIIIYCVIVELEA